MSRRTLIDKETFSEFYRDYEKGARRRKKQQGGADFYIAQNVKLDRRFVSAVVRAVQERRLPYGNAYRRTGLRGQTFDRFTKTLGANAAE